MCQARHGYFTAFVSEYYCGLIMFYVFRELYYKTILMI